MYFRLQTPIAGSSRNVTELLVVDRIVTRRCVGLSHASNILLVDRGYIVRTVAMATTIGSGPHLALKSLSVLIGVVRSFSILDRVFDTDVLEGLEAECTGVTGPAGWFFGTVATPR